MIVSSKSCKRLIDMMIASVLLLMFSPILVSAIIAIWFADPGSIFFRQWREGLDGKPFLMLKFRTMYRNADAILEKHLEENQEAKNEWLQYLRLAHDPRTIHLIGPIMRKFSIDELPQLWNILRGDMSLVGPRPFALELLQHLIPSVRMRRQTVLPGLTGLWQVSGRSDLNIHQLQVYDLLYLKKRSLKMDVWILWRTIPAVMKGTGAY
jgi:lipopolysaccharide/colanic/teichoic acid biosynthesis glycosyltransferase